MLASTLTLLAPQGQEVRLAEKEPVAKHEPAAMKESAAMKKPAAEVQKETMQASCRPASLPPSPPLLTYYLLTFDRLRSMRSSITTTTRTQCQRASGSKATGGYVAPSLSRPSRSSAAPSLSRTSRSNAARSLSRPRTRQRRHRHSPLYLARVHTVHFSPSLNNCIACTYFQRGSTLELRA